MGRAVLPPCYLTWGQTTVEVIKIMVISFKRSHAYTATLRAPNPGAGHRRPTPLADTPGPSQASLGQSLVGLLLLSPGCAQGFVCALQESVFPVLCQLWQLYGGISSDLLQEGLFHTLVEGCCWSVPPHSSTQTQVWLSLCVVSWCVQGYVWAFPVSLAGMRFDSKCNFAPPTIFLGLLLCPWKGIFFGGIQHSPADRCSAVCCNFGVLAGEDEHISFYFTILNI